VPTPRKIRIELDEVSVRTVHAALSAAELEGAQRAAARDVLASLERRVPDLAAPAPAADPPAAIADPDELVDVLYAERRPSRWAYRPAVQAIARLGDAEFDVLAAQLRTRGLLEPGDADDLTLTDAGATLARERWAATSTVPHWQIPAPPLPYRELPVRVEPDDRGCPSAGCDGEAAWLKAKSRAAAFKTLVRDGSVEWTCPACSRKWVVYLQAHEDDGAPAYRDPVDGTYNRPLWRRSR
jgi:hypothetical protein